MINSVNICSNEYGLYINLLKTKIVIFRNRGHIRPILLVKKLEKCPSNFTQHFSFEYIDLITLSSLPVTLALTIILNDKHYQRL
jgi:hypothetical protein